jgi:hypothetical protein
LTYVVLWSEGLRTTPVAIDIVVNPAVEFKPVEGNRLFAEGDFGEKGTDLGVELVAVHTQVARRIPQPDQAGLELKAGGRSAGGQGWGGLSVHEADDASLQFR